MANHSAKEEAGSFKAKSKGRPQKPPTASNRLGRRLRSRRNALGMTIATLSGKTAMSNGRISMYETGHLVPGRGPLCRLAAALEIDPHILWRLRASSLASMEIRRLIRQAGLAMRRVAAIIEQEMAGQEDIRMRRLLPVDE